METLHILLIIFSTLTACTITLVEALWYKYSEDRSRWAKFMHTLAGLVGCAVFLCLAVIIRRFWPSVLAIWVVTFMLWGDLVFLLFLHRKETKQWFFDLTRDVISSARRLYTWLHDLLLLPTSVDEILLTPSSLPTSAAGHSSFRDDTTKPPGPALTQLRLSGGRTGSQPDATPILQMDTDCISIPPIPHDSATSIAQCHDPDPISDQYFGQ